MIFLIWKTWDVIKFNFWKFFIDKNANWIFENNWKGKK